jgi:hypothetical protein
MNKFKIPFEMKKAFIKTKKDFHKNLLMVIFFLVFYLNSNNAQWYPNGSFVTISFIDTIKSNIENENLIKFDSVSPGLDVNLTIEVFIVSNMDGNVNYSISNLNSSIIIANQYFKNIGIKFKQGRIDTIPEYKYAYITHMDSTAEMIVKYAKPDKIHLFLVDSIVLNNTNFFGYSIFPDVGQSLIFMRKDQLYGNNLTTLLGNCFGLLLTHESAAGVELVNGANCKTKGDFLCDTYADGGLFPDVTTDCHYTGASTDDNGEYFVPSVANMMSDSPEWCKCFFSDGQYRRMKFYFLKYLQHLK